MTSNQQRLEELRQQAKNLAQQIERLEDQINNAQPTTGLLGRWAKHSELGDVLVVVDRQIDQGLIHISYPSNISGVGALDGYVRPDSLTFPEQTTRPQDVPVGEAWLVDATDGHDQAQQTKALKVSDAYWITPDAQPGDETQWLNSEITLITPLTPARPHDTPETVTTEDEYEALPEGSVVAKPSGSLWIRGANTWVYGSDSTDSATLSGVTRHVLRRGWGISPANS